MCLSVSLSFLLLLFVTEYQPTDGATCMVVSTCEQTDYTLASCDMKTKVCGCKDGYLPIRSGCGKNLAAPQISPPVNNSLQVNANANFTLTCGPVVDGMEYEIFKNNASLINGTQYTAPAESGSNSFSCRAKAGEVYSDLSPAVKIEIIDKDFSKVKTRIFIPVAKVFNMSEVTVQCLDIPMGFNGSVKFNVNGTKTDNPKIIVSSDNAGLSVSCVLNSPENQEIGNSSAGKLPDIATAIENVTVTVEGQAGQDTVVLKSGHNLTLVCVTPYGYPEGGPTYQWKKDDKDIGTAKTDSKYHLTDADITTATYKCSAIYQGLNMTSSNSIKVIINDTYLMKPNLTASSSKPLKGGRLNLYCGDASIQGVTYQWQKGNAAIPRQFDRVIQLDYLTEVDNGDYNCSITRDNFVVFSNRVTVTVGSSIDTPVVTREGLNTNSSDLSLGASCTLTCTTAAVSVGMTYTWLVNGTVKQDNFPKTYNISSATYSDAGNYTCKAKLSDLTSNLSEIFLVKIVAPGVICSDDTKCANLGTSYTGKCDTSTSRCTCSNHYVMKGEKCENGAISVISSTLIVAYTYVLTKMFTF